MKKSILFAVIASFGLGCHSMRGDNEIGFIEKFVLSTNREVALGQLVPGTEDYYFYSALHYQTTGEKEKFEGLLKSWAARFPVSERRQLLENRQALMGYDSDPQGTLEFLKRRLNPKFDHAQEAQNQSPDLPTVLDPTRISRDEFLKEALTHDDLAEVTDMELDRLVREKVVLRPPQIREILNRLTRPDVPGLVELVAENLKSQESRGFGEFPIHRLLLPGQLDQLEKLVPQVAEQPAFVFSRLRKLGPSSEQDTEFNPADREAWLTRVQAYVATLPQSFNSLKAHVLYARLEYDRSRGIYDRSRFLEYVKLPRPVGYINPDYLKRDEIRRYPVDLTATFDEAHLNLPPIRSDEGLVRDYLLRLLVDEADWKAWSPWLREDWLKPVFGEAKITAGVGDPEQWASLLSPSAYQALKERVDVEFAPENPQFIKPSDEVGLLVTLKNTPKLIVKIYEVNTLNFFLSQKRSLNTDLNLDGLVANSEETYDGEASPFKRVRRRFAFPALTGRRGAWVIEFIGGGKSSRALIRKGQYSLLAQVGAGGDLVTVVDENHEVVQDAAVWLDGRKLVSSDGGGKILVPFTANPEERSIVIGKADGSFASLAQFQHSGESYQLDAHFFVEREQLLSRRTATIAVRPEIWLGSLRVAPELLESAGLTLTTVSLDGVSTTAEIPVGKLSADSVFTHSFRVPEHLASLAATLHGKINVLTKGGETQDLSANHQWNVNRMDKADAVSVGHLSKFGGEHVFELLGRNGEPIPNQQVVFEFHREGFIHAVSVPLRTDAAGRIQLGKLAGIYLVTTEFAGAVKRQWHLIDYARTWPSVIHARAGEPVRVPWNSDLLPDTLSLLETKGQEFVSDQSDKVKLTGSFIELSGLSPGDFSLRLKGDGLHNVVIRISEGVEKAGWVLSANRSIQARQHEFLQIKSVELKADSLFVQLQNWDAHTRVHIAATRFIPGTGLFGGLGGLRENPPSWSTPDRLPNLFANGRAIGDEYRYILERRYAAKYPGNQLARPGLLLNPWEKRSTDAVPASQAASAPPAAMRGEKFGAMNAAVGDFNARDATEGAMDGEFPNLDFLAEAAPVLFNLTPDTNGVVQIPRNAIGDRQQVQVFAGDLTSAVWASVTLEEQKTRFRDLRLARNLDPGVAFTEVKEVSLLTAGSSVTVSDISNGEFEVYDTLASVHALFTSLTGDPTLAKFSWILSWPRLSEAERRAKYSEFACHELNLFLSRKDPQFFKRVIQPHLRNKKDKTFIDDYLLEVDLHRYLEPWRYAQLNAAEKALLGQRIPAESAATARHLRELWELLPPNSEADDNLFRTAINGRALETLVTNGVVPAGGAKVFRDLKEQLPIVAETLSAPVSVSGAVGLRSKAAGRFATAAQDKRKGAALGLESQALGMEDATLFRRRRTLAEEQDAVFVGADRASGQRGAALTLAYYRELGPTKEWAENHYYHLPLEQQNAGLVAVNAFWRDLAEWNGKAPFLSIHFAEAHRNFTEMLLVLAVLDLPFEAPKHSSKADGGRYQFTAGGPAIAYHKELKPAEAIGNGGQSLLISENFFRNGDRFRQEGNDKVDKFVTGEFLTGVVYGAQIVLSNPTAAPLKLDVLTEVPQGAIPVLASKSTHSQSLRLLPYATQQLNYYFYFPESNTNGLASGHFPAHAAVAGKSAGAALRTDFKVVRQLSQVDESSWDYLSQYGSETNVFAFLERNNLGRIDLERIAWRARASIEFFRRLVSFLERRHLWSEPVYRYSMVHNDPATLREWLRHQDEFVNRCGRWLSTRLLEIDPTERRSFEHFEYSPLVNQRAHRLGAEAGIANTVIRKQYQEFLEILSFKPVREPIDDLTLVYYLFLQDRIGEALELFHRLGAEAVSTRIQYDYLRCYAAFYEEDLSTARNLAAKYADYPVDRWRGFFAEVLAQLDEIEGKKIAQPGDPKDREKQQEDLAAKLPSFEFKVENQRISVSWRNLGEITVNYYLMDPEFLFSSSPFVTQESDRFSIIKPTRSATMSLPVGTNHLEVSLPPEFATANVLVELVGAGQRRAQAIHSSSFKLILAENYGRLEVRNPDGDKPLSKVYVKVYARLSNGTIRFLKDGYTDLRGKFDYASVNTGPGVGLSPQAVDARTGSAGLDTQMLRPDEFKSVERIAILVLSESHGAAVREVAPPRM
jgi:hypothetical protein